MNDEGILCQSCPENFRMLAVGIYGGVPLCSKCLDKLHSTGWVEPVNKITEITPDLNRRVQAERRRETRERVAELERRLSRIASLIAESGYADSDSSPRLMEAYRLAVKGTRFEE